MVEERKVVIGPNSEDYTGYSMFVMVGTSNAAVEDISFQGTLVIPALGKSEKDGAEKEYIFPETREEVFLDESLVKFYKKKGYQP